MPVANFSKDIYTFDIQIQQIKYAEMSFDYLIFHRLVSFSLEKKCSIVTISASERNNIALLIKNYSLQKWFKRKYFKRLKGDSFCFQQEKKRKKKYSNNFQGMTTEVLYQPPPEKLSYTFLTLSI